MRREGHIAQFAGAKIALLFDGKVVTILRDDIPGIHFPNRWDLPGGGREALETPIETALRETREEIGISIPPDRPQWSLRTRNSIGQRVWFFAGPLSETELNAIRLGDEGQRWELMDIDDFVGHPQVVPYLAERLLRYVNRPLRHRQKRWPI